MTTAVTPVASTESDDFLIIEDKPYWTRCDRPSQKFIGRAALPDAKGKTVVYDVYVYGRNAEAIGLRFGHHPRDEHTHTAQYWNRLQTPTAQALRKALQQWVRKWERNKPAPPG